MKKSNYIINNDVDSKINNKNYNFFKKYLFIDLAQCIYSNKHYNFYAFKINYFFYNRHYKTNIYKIKFYYNKYF